MKKYPNISQILSKYKIGGKCILCGKENADSKMVVEVSIFRGDDEVFLVHKECTKGNKDRILEIIYPKGVR